MKFYCALLLSLTLITSKAQVVTPLFTAADTVCVNKPFVITNISSGATNYYWSFCSANLDNSTIQIEDMGNLSGQLKLPVFMDYVFSNNNYYGFVTNYSGGNLIRLDFGTSLLNTPTTVNLGNFLGVLPSGVGTEGIQIVQNEGKWYAIIVSGYTPSGSSPKIVKIEFGANITNPNPTITDWGNIGNLYQPIDFQMFQENGNWYGFTVNAENNTITRFDFTNSFNNTPTAVNLGNLGNLSYPTGLYAINDGGNWMLFITNGGDNTRVGGVSSITRLDFGSSLLNTPTAVNLGNLNNTLGHPRDLTIMRSCDQIIGYVVNGNPGYENIVKIDFHNNLKSQPTGTSLSNANFAFPHSISKLFRVNETVYGFITDAQNNTISRLKVSGCNNSSIPNSTAQTPPQISYNQPGTYNVNLTVDIGLPTQSSFCKQVVVQDCSDSSIITNDITICAGSHQLIKTHPADSYDWSPGLYLDDSTAANPVATPAESITYYVEAFISATNTIIRDSIHINVEKSVVKANEDTTICAGSAVQLNVDQGTSFNWSPEAGLTDSKIPNPIARPLTTTQYVVTGIGTNRCASSDTVLITVLPQPQVVSSNDTLICGGSPVQLNAAGGTSYAWSPSQSLNDGSIANPISTTYAPTTYLVKVTGNNGCSNTDTVLVDVVPYPAFATSGNVSACEGDEITVSASGGTTFEWTPASQLKNPNSSSTVFSPSGQSTTLYVHMTENFCNYDTTMAIQVVVNPNPQILVAKSNDINCTVPTAQLTATGGDSYFWTPFVHLDDANSATPVAAVDTTTTFTVTGYNDAGCSDTSYVTVKVEKGGIPRFVVPNAFSPNGDGLNDCFGIKRWGNATVNQFSIYNRWGQIIFKTSKVSDCWDGRLNGIPQAAGGYIYIIDATTFCGAVQRKGMLFLIR